MKKEESKSDETVHIPDEVQSATADVSEAAVGAPAENNDPSVAVTIDAAQSATVEITTNDVSTVVADLNAAEAILNPEMKKDSEGNTLGVTGEIEAIQSGINSSYTEDALLKTLLPSITVDDNGNTVFTDADDDDITWQIGGTEVTDPEGNTGTQYTVSKKEKTGENTSTTNVNLNTSFDGTEGNGDGSFEIGKNIKSAVENAGKAENAENKKDAESFKASAEVAIGDAETQFNIDSANLDEAVEAVNEAQSRYDALEEQARKAEKAFNELQDLLKEAKGAAGQTTALHEQLKAAETKANSLAGAAEEAYNNLASQQEDLNLLRNIKAANDVVEAIVKVSEGTSFKEDDNYKSAARNLSKLLIEYYVKKGALTINNSSTASKNVGIKDTDIILADGTRLEIGENFSYSITNLVPNENDVVTGQDNIPMQQITKKETTDYTNTADDNGWINETGADRIVVYLKDKDGNVIGESWFNYQANDDGTVFIYDREMNLIETVHDAKGGAAEQWSDPVYTDADGNSLDESRYVTYYQIVNVEEDGKVVKKIVPDFLDDISEESDFPESKVVYLLENDIDNNSNNEKNKKNDDDDDDDDDDNNNHHNHRDDEYDDEGFSKNKIDWFKETFKEDAYAKYLRYQVINYTKKEKLSDVWEAICLDDGSYNFVNTETYSCNFETITYRPKRYLYHPYLYIEDVETNIHDDVRNFLVYKRDSIGVKQGEAARIADSIEYQLSHKGKGEGLYYTDTGNVIVVRGLRYKWSDGSHSYKCLLKIYKVSECNRETSQASYHYKEVYGGKEYNYQEGQKIADAVQGYDKYTTKALGWKSDEESIVNAKIAGKLTDYTESARTVNTTDYKERLNYLSQLDKAQEEATKYRTLAGKVTEAVTASETFMTMLNDFEYTGYTTPVKMPDGYSEPEAPYTYSFDKKSDDYIGKILSNIKGNIEDAKEQIGAAVERRNAFGEELANAKTIVANIVLKNFGSGSGSDSGLDSGSESGSRSNEGSETGSTTGTGNMAFSEGDVKGAGESAKITKVTQTTNSSKTVSDNKAATDITSESNGDTSGNTADTANTQKTVASIKPAVMLADDNSAKDVANAAPDSSKPDAVKIANPETPLAASPQEKTSEMRFALLLGLGAAAGAGAITFGTHKKKKADEHINS